MSENKLPQYDTMDAAMSYQEKRSPKRNLQDGMDTVKSSLDAMVENLASNHPESLEGIILMLREAAHALGELKTEVERM